MIQDSIITCPHCGKARLEKMPIDACQFFYNCTGCGARLKPRPGDCCVFCSYGSAPCPPVQAQCGGAAACSCCRSSGNGLSLFSREGLSLSGPIGKTLIGSMLLARAAGNVKSLCSLPPCHVGTPRPRRRVCVLPRARGVGCSRRGGDALSTFCLHLRQ